MLRQLLPSLICVTNFLTLNVDNCDEGKQAKKKFQEQYTEKDDFRLKVYIYLFISNYNVYHWHSGLVMTSHLT